ncbi:hypothetical protein BDZ97DRAFT_701390 [Flammula alnicola]|nr:hypothetical protein BDZ97DRAFT_701390 [Flammula alnicola]
MKCEIASLSMPPFHRVIEGTLELQDRTVLKMCPPISVSSSPEALCHSQPAACTSLIPLTRCRLLRVSFNQALRQCKGPQRAS